MDPGEGTTVLTGEQQMARVFKALGDENRITILQKLQYGETCACKLLETRREAESPRCCEE